MLTVLIKGNVHPLHSDVSEYINLFSFSGDSYLKLIFIKLGKYFKKYGVSRLCWPKVIGLVEDAKKS